MDYKIVFIPFIALFGTQLIKVIIDSFKGEFSWSNLNRYGGMPSSHSAMVAALCTEIGTQAGFNSPAFAIALAISFLIVRDAVGLRRQLGNHSKILNMIIKDLPDKDGVKYPFLEQRLGHNYVQAGVGILIGIILSLLI